MSIAATLLGVLAFVSRQPPVIELSESEREEFLELAVTHLRGGEFESAKQAIDFVLEGDAVPPRAYLVAGEIAFRGGDVPEALSYFQKVPEDGSIDAANAQMSMGDIYFGTQRFTPAEACYRKALTIVPRQRIAHERLAFIYNFEGRRHESVPHLMELIRQRSFNVQDLCMLTNMQAVNIADKEETEAVERLAEEPAYLVGLARKNIEGGSLDKAEEQLKETLAALPDLLEAKVWLGRVYVLSKREVDYYQWNDSLPPAADRHPEVWHSRALWEIGRGNNDAAIRCLWEGLRLDSNYPVLARLLVETLAKTGRQALAAELADWKGDLVELAIISQRVFDDPYKFQADLVADAAHRCERLGRYWEACAWAQISSEMDPSRSDVVELLNRLTPKLTPELPRQVPRFDPVLRVDLSDLPLPADTRELVANRADTELGNPPKAAALEADSQIRLRDDSAALGVDFEFFFSEDRSTPGGRMFEFTGGGVAALDYDRSGLVDLYLTQGAPWPVESAQKDYVDRLFRQQPNGRFAEVSAQAGVEEYRFSQGVTFGDVDQDGFHDLYVGNIGSNRLFRNNGDGTFSDITTEANLDRDKWTTSVLIADLNGDGFPDLYDTNYIHGDDVYERICEREGSPGACAPIGFRPLGDDVSFSRGDGTFFDGTEASGLHELQGNGLGIQLVRPAGVPEPHLFVANDMNANLFLKCEQEQTGEAGVKFVDTGVLSGLAYSGGNKAQACMGVAVGDVDNDGAFEVFVTNFEHEYNTLYRPFAPGYYSDESKEFQTIDSSLPYVSFGTEFADLDLDGFDDLFIVSGHVDEVGGERTNYFQPPQVLRNEQGKHFREIPGEVLGPYFRPDRRGRSVARMDWNRDGLVDFAVSNLDAPAAILTNESKPLGRSLRIRLVATHGDRDALTAICRVKGDTITKSAQLTSGDGYQTANERVLSFGLGAIGSQVSLEVEWPNGERSVYDGLEPDSAYVVVQGRRDVFYDP